MITAEYGAFINGQDKKEKLAAFFEYVMDQLTFTLASKVDGYKTISGLKNDFEKDSCLDADLVANLFGYVNFETFFISKELSSVVEIHRNQNEKDEQKAFTFYSKHVLDNKDGRFRKLQGIQDREERMEQEKYSRAMLPQNADKVIEGRKRMLEIVHRLGGETKPVYWQMVQDHYFAKYGERLAGDELRKFFSRDKAFKILSTFCADDYELHESQEHTGMVYLKMKKPYQELLEAINKIEASKQALEKKAVDFKELNKRANSLTTKNQPPTRPIIPYENSELITQYQEIQANAPKKPAPFGGNQTIGTKFANMRPTSSSMNEINHKINSSNMNLINVKQVGSKEKKIPSFNTQELQINKQESANIIKYTNRVKNGTYTNSEADTATDSEFEDQKLKRSNSQYRPLSISKPASNKINGKLKNDLIMPNQRKTLLTVSEESMEEGTDWGSKLLSDKSKSKTDTTNSTQKRMEEFIDSEHDVVNKKRFFMNPPLKTDERAVNENDQQPINREKLAQIEAVCAEVREQQGLHRKTQFENFIMKNSDRVTIRNEPKNPKEAIKTLFVATPINKNTHRNLNFGSVNGTNQHNQSQNAFIYSQNTAHPSFSSTKNNLHKKASNPIPMINNNNMPIGGQNSSTSEVAANNGRNGQGISARKNTTICNRENRQFISSSSSSGKSSKDSMKLMLRRSTIPKRNYYHSSTSREHRKRSPYFSNDRISSRTQSESSKYSLFSLMKHWSDLVEIANTYGLTHEIRNSECTFVFRSPRSSRVLSIIESQKKLRVFTYRKNEPQSQNEWDKCSRDLFKMAIETMCQKFFASTKLHWQTYCETIKS